jgi:predicted NAD/FAD-dependent oxidoreductase
MKYDIIIIGAGPSGLTIAQTCSSLNLKILVIDKNDEIGGCHRVTRINNYFTEHGPRIYSSTYINLMNLLQEMNVNFYDLFTEYNFQFTTIGQKTILSTINFYELSILFFDFIKLIIDDKYGEITSMKDHLNNNNFSLSSINIIDKICRLTDGGDISKYSLNKFLQLVNQQFFYKIYQPKFPNDKNLFKIWKSFLESKNVDFKLNTIVDSISKNDNLFIVNTKNSILYCDKLIIATPPIQLVKILQNSPNIKNAFGDYNDLQKWAINSNYNVYVQITFHWIKKLKLDKIYGFTSSEWGIVYIVLSDYMKFDESNTVISIAVTNINAKSSFSNKTTNESSKQEIINEVFRVLQLSYPKINKPDMILFNPHTKFINNEWISDDTAFISDPIFNKHISFESDNIKNLYNVGTHNGKNYYKFTSMESAITNALFLSHILYPKLQNKYIIKKLTTVRDIIKYIFIIIIIFLLFYLYKWKKS